MNPPLLELTDAVAVLGGARVLDGLTLTIREGEHTAILGPNGAGKSTLVKLLAMDHYPLAGDGAAAVRVFGRARWDVLALRSQLGIVSADLHERFVRGNANGRLTGLDAVLSGFFGTQGTFAHQPVSDAMRRRALGALKRIGAERLAGATLNTMSTGEARRVVIARALVHEPRALVLDEPTRGLDLVSRHQFMERIRAVARQGTTLLLITHHVDEIVPEIGRVMLLKDGRIAADGDKAEVLTPTRLSAAFGAPVAIDRAGGYFFARCE